MTITVRVDLDLTRDGPDPESDVDVVAWRRAAMHAVHEALLLAKGEGFTRPLEGGVEIHVRGVALVTDTIVVNAPEILHLGRFQVTVVYTEGGEERRQTARLPFAWLARRYCRALERRWAQKRPRCVVWQTPGAAPPDDLPPHQPRLFKAAFVTA